MVISFFSDGVKSRFFVKTIGLDSIGLEPKGLEPIGLEPIGFIPIGLNDVRF